MRYFFGERAPMTASVDRWGPFADGLDPAERVARLRCLRTIVHLCCGWRGHRLKDCLWRAERNDTALVEALAALDVLEPLDRRRVLATYAALSKPV